MGTVIAALAPLLAYLLPLIGKALLMIPFVPNKAIPFLLGTMNVIHKYWLLLGFPTAVAAVDRATGGHFALLGIGGMLLPLAWGVAENYLFHGHYEWRRAMARAAGTESWWEKGRTDLWQKKAS